MIHCTQKVFADAIKKQKKHLIINGIDLSSQLPKALDVTDLFERYAVDQRERLFPIQKTVELFLNQVFSADQSCQEVVQQRIAIESNQQCWFSSNTAGYCKARQRLAKELIHVLSKRLGHHLSQSVPPSWRWCGRCVKLVDGTTVSMPDTQENQARYPQSKTQKEGLGFPIARLVILSGLSSGAVLSHAIGNYNTSEHALFRTLMDELTTEDVLVGDQYYGTFF